MSNTRRYCPNILFPDRSTAYYPTPDFDSTVYNMAGMGYPSLNPNIRRSRAQNEAGKSFLPFGRSNPLGPYFKPTKQTCNLYSLDHSRTYTARIYPRLERGFFIAENDWTCYRRNYFQVVSAFTAFDATGAKIEFPCLVDIEGRGMRTVTQFSLHVTSKSSTGREIELIQHTAKRDKGPQMIPQPKHCEPSEYAPNVNGCGPNTLTARRFDPDCKSTVVWERVQFKSATANNGKRYLDLLFVIFSEADLY